MNTLIETRLKAAFASELAQYDTAEGSLSKWNHLERLHIIGQSFLFFHLKVHWLMLKLALQEAKSYEVFGQMFRLLLVIPGHTLKRLPIGNIGTSRVSAFQKMEIPEDIKELMK